MGAPRKPRSEWRRRFFQIAIVILVAAGAGVERGTAISMARHTGLHHGNQNVLRLSAGAGLNVTALAFHGAMGAVGELAARQPRVAIGLALHVTAGHAIHGTHHTVAGRLVAVSALAREQVLLRIPRHPLQPRRPIRDRRQCRAEGTPCQARVGLKRCTIGAGDVLVNRLGILGVRRGAGRGTQYVVHIEFQFARVAAFAILLEGHGQNGSGIRRAVGDVAIGALHGQLHAANRLWLRGHVDRMIQTQRPHVFTGTRHRTQDDDSVQRL